MHAIPSLAVVKLHPHLRAHICLDMKHIFNRRPKKHNHESGPTQEIQEGGEAQGRSRVDDSTQELFSTTPRLQDGSSRFIGNDPSSSIRPMSINVRSTHIPPAINPGRGFYEVSATLVPARINDALVRDSPVAGVQQEVAPATQSLPTGSWPSENSDQRTHGHLRSPADGASEYIMKFGFPWDARPHEHTAISLFKILIVKILLKLSALTLAPLLLHLLVPEHDLPLNAAIFSLVKKVKEGQQTHDLDRLVTERTLAEASSEQSSECRIIDDDFKKLQASYCALRLRAEFLYLLMSGFGVGLACHDYTLLSTLFGLLIVAMAFLGAVLTETTCWIINTIDKTPDILAWYLERNDPEAGRLIQAFLLIPYKWLAMCASSGFIALELALASGQKTATPAVRLVLFSLLQPFALLFVIDGAIIVLVSLDDRTRTRQVLIPSIQQALKLSVPHDQPTL